VGDAGPGYRTVDLGASTADATNVGFQWSDDCLALRFRDWKELSPEIVFRGVLAFRWQEFDPCQFPSLRDDSSYEVLESDWLERQCDLQRVDPAGYAHYRLCFNGVGVLDVLSEPMTER
jgi:hypothetical protein